MIAVATNAPLCTLAHEIGHACGLDDIAHRGLANLVSPALLGWDNWSGGGGGTGYYPGDLKHYQLVERLLMFQSIDTRGDIPLGDVVGCDPDDENIPPQMGPMPVGLNSMNREPRH